MQLHAVTWNNGVGATGLDAGLARVVVVEVARHGAQTRPIRADRAAGHRLVPGEVRVRDRGGSLPAREHERATRSGDRGVPDEGAAARRERLRVAAERLRER
ncbi:MAG: hypothetical protein RLZ84_417, partial [Actinomycetota bacterium]